MEKSLKEAAESLAKSQPDYAGKSAFPPTAWWVVDQELYILCADGRKVHAPLPAKQLTLKISMHDRSAETTKSPKGEKPGPEAAQSQPVHGTQSQPAAANAKSSDAGPKSPANHKAGK